MTPEESGRLFRELGLISGQLSGIRDSIAAHERLDVIRHDDIDRRLAALENAADVTGKTSLEDVKRRASELETAQRREAADALNTRRATTRSAILLCVGGLITIAFNYAARKLGLVP